MKFSVVTPTHSPTPVLTKRRASSWCKGFPWKIGKLAVYRNADTRSFPPIEYNFYIDGKGVMWKEWGAIYFGIRVFKWWLKFRYSVGTKTKIIPRWMLP